MIRWLTLLFVALIIGAIGLLVQQNFLEALGLLIALIAIVMLIWSVVHPSLTVRPPTTRRRFRRIHVPHIHIRRSHTEELHAAIFQDPNAE